MTKVGRLYAPIDVNWYDEWGHAVSNNAALLWILAVGLAKRVKSPTLTLAQLRRVAPLSLTPTDYSNAVGELIGCDIAPISGDDRAIVLHGWDDWNDPNGASENGTYGNHIRWHVNAGTPDLTCGYCSDRPDIAPMVAPDSLRVEQSRVKKSKDARSDDDAKFESDFNECWQFYPRKVARKAALSAYVARRRQAVPVDTLLAAVQHFAKQMEREQRDETRIMHGSTFFGPDDRWEDYVKPPEPERVEPVARGAGPLFADEAERASAYGEPIDLNG